MRILSDKRCIIGEGPVWCEFDKKVWQVNGYGGDEIFCIDLKSGEQTVRKLDFGVAAIAFTEAGEMLISCMDGAFILNPDGSRVPLYDTEKYEIKYGNDAKVGPDGAFYVGTQSSKRLGMGDKIDGKLFRIDGNGNAKVILDGLILSNGFDWSMDEKCLYHTDSDTGIIKEYDFDIKTGDLSFTGRQLKVDSVDGFTIDQNDNLFVACWGRGHIAVVDTKTMEIKEYLKTPAKITTSCAFAGDSMRNLVITTATLGANFEIDPEAGRTIVCEMNTEGRKPYLFKKGT